MTIKRRSQYNKNRQNTLKTSSMQNNNNSDEEITFIQTKSSLTPTQQTKLSLWQKFINLSTSSTALTAFIVSKLAIILGLSIGSTLIITRSFKSQLLEQAKSEINIANLNYNSKLKEIELTLIGKSNHTAIIKAAELYTLTKTLSQEIEAEVKQILKHEIKTLQIEYATLVGIDGRIIVNANTNRKGEVFDPNGLVSGVLINPKPIKNNTIVRWTELKEEAPPLPPELNNKDALIRYVVTPVKSQSGDQVIGVLVAGDIVNGKQAIVEKTLQATGEGYSAVYMNKGQGNFVLATALDKAEGTGLSEAKADVDLPDKSILAKAVKNNGKVVTEETVIGSTKYMLAAKAVPNEIMTEFNQDVPVFKGQSVAILVQGISEFHFQNILWLQQLLVVLLALIMIVIWTYIFKLAIIKPIEQLKYKIQKFVQGDRGIRAEIGINDEVGQLAAAFNQMADRMTEQAYYQENEGKLAQLVNNIIFRMRGSFTVTQILNVAVTTVREAIKTDRVLVYRFDENWVGKIVAESVGKEWSAAFGAEIADPCFTKGYIDKYQRGRVQAVENIYEANLTQCHIAQLAAFEVKANLVAPILINNKLYGLLIAHHCSSPRRWQELEINFFKQVAIPIGYALEQAFMLEQVDKARSQAEMMAIEQSQQKEALQQQILKLLRDVERVSKGDLTVHAEVGQGDIGTVADFFNYVIENLREIVTKVKASAIEVNTAISKNEDAIRQLADKAIKQANEISRTLSNVERMSLSIATVADNAQKAAQIAHEASHTAQTGEAAMDLTVQKIVNLRLTIDDTAKKVKRLGESSQQISRIVSLINEIATQTNLLAINAGLEASRAGQQSQGFVVVAAEVGELAARCSDATQEIKQIVENIKRETNEVVKAMEQGTIQVMEGSRVFENAKISLNQILSVSRQIDELVQSISQATVSQVETSQTVATLINEISQVSDTTSNSSRQISQSLQETVKISQELESSVAKFKVD